MSSQNPAPGEYALADRRRRIGKTFSRDCLKCGKTFSYVSILGGSQKLCRSCKAAFIDNMLSVINRHEQDSVVVYARPQKELMLDA